MANDLQVYSDDERDVAALVTGQGMSYAGACREIFGADVKPSVVAAIRQRISPLVREIQAQSVEIAALGRAELIEQARQDRDFAVKLGNPAAAVAATKLLAQLAGAVNDSGAVDPVSLLNAVERIVAAKTRPIDGN